jgi:hypothetical protein
VSIVIRSGLLAAVATVAPFFAANGVSATVDVAGWKRRWRQGHGNRVVFVPSEESGAGGTLVGPHMVGGRNIRDPNAVDPTKRVAEVRSLMGWERSVTVSVWAVDHDNKESEAAQIEATEALFEWTVRAVHAAPGAFASVRWGATRWEEARERSYGLELLASMTFVHPVYDVPRDIYYPAAALVARGGPVPAPVPDPGGDT